MIYIVVSSPTLWLILSFALQFILTNRILHFNVTESNLMIIYQPFPFRCDLCVPFKRTYYEVIDILFCLLSFKVYLPFSLFFFFIEMVTVFKNVKNLRLSSEVQVHYSYKENQMATKKIARTTGFYQKNQYQDKK